MRYGHFKGLFRPDIAKRGAHWRAARQLLPDLLLGTRARPPGASPVARATLARRLGASSLLRGLHGHGGAPARDRRAEAGALQGLHLDGWRCVLQPARACWSVAGDAGRPRLERKRGCLVPAGGQSIRLVAPWGRDERV